MEILQNLAMFMIFGSPFVFIAGLIVTAVNKTNKKNRIVFGSWFGYRLYNWFRNLLKYAKFTRISLIFSVNLNFRIKPIIHLV